MSQEVADPAAPERAGWKQVLTRNVLALGTVSLLTDISSEMTLWTVPFFIALLGGGVLWIWIVEGFRES